MTNHILNKINITDNQNCSFCNTEDKTIEHIFWDCDIVQNSFLMKSIFGSDNYIPNVDMFTKTQIFLGDFDQLYRNAYNIILLNIKKYIYMLLDVLKRIYLSVHLK